VTLLDTMVLHPLVVRTK